jgi:hypothetical protein
VASWNAELCIKHGWNAVPCDEKQKKPDETNETK